ncbi:hypothetical protein BAnh1_11180 [Bartonella australis AUST/NH1]|uniref:Uncharacterized protein n=1 Tax=Bartonella australis (strain Aust/NH1) TaxID=1094489 RepID=M1PEE4_BARAA|nr:hypothetical protein BAnh1_11180 [Bartonella australis AUST/NH1]
MRAFLLYISVCSLAFTLQASSYTVALRMSGYLPGGERGEITTSL